MGEYDWMTGKKKRVTYRSAVNVRMHPDLKRVTDRVSEEFGVSKLSAGGLVGDYLEDHWDKIRDDLKRRQGGKKPW